MDLLEQIGGRRAAMAAVRATGVRRIGRGTYLPMEEGRGAFELQLEGDALTVEPEGGPSRLVDPLAGADQEERSRLVAQWGDGELIGDGHLAVYVAHVLGLRA